MDNILRNAATVLMALLLMAGFAHAASLSLTLSSLSSITQGSSATLSASVQAVGGEVSNVQLSLGALPAGLSTSDSLLQSVGNLSAGQSSTKSWTISGDSAGTYNLTVTASGTSVTSQTSTASLVVNAPAFIDVQNFSCTPTSLNIGDTVTISFNLRNTGGESATATSDLTYDSSFLTLSAGTDPWSNDLNAGATGSVSWSLTADAAAERTLTITNTSTSNNPEDKSCTVDIAAATSTPTGGGQETEEPAADNGSGGGGGSGGAAPPPTAQERAREVLLDKIVSETFSREQAETLLSQAGITDFGKIVSEQMRIKRGLRVEKITDDENNVSYESTFSIELENPGGVALQNLGVIEHIPKNVAERASEILSSFAMNVIREDPVIEFRVPLVPAGGTATVTYSVEKELDENVLDDFEGGAVYLREEDICEGVTCPGTACTESRCNPDTGRCVVTRMFSGTPCGTNGLCEQGTCIEGAAEPTGPAAETPSQAPPTGTEEAEGFDPVPMAIFLVVLIAGGLLLAYYWRGHKKEPEPPRPKTLADLR